MASSPYPFPEVIIPSFFPILSIFFLLHSPHPHRLPPPWLLPNISLHFVHLHHSGQNAQGKVWPPTINSSILLPHSMAIVFKWGAHGNMGEKTNLWGRGGLARHTHFPIPFYFTQPSSPSPQSSSKLAFTVNKLAILLFKPSY